MTIGQTLLSIRKKYDVDVSEFCQRLFMSEAELYVIENSADADIKSEMVWRYLRELQLCSKLEIPRDFTTTVRIGNTERNLLKNALCTDR
jgi:hypothetical protein